jgi:molybdopterin synthase sulfur carrier subunit
VSYDRCNKVLGRVTREGLVGARDDPAQPRINRMGTNRLLRAPRRIAVHVPSPLRSYTRGEATLAVSGATLETVDDVLRALDRRSPGFRFRIVDELGRLRPHIRIFQQQRPVEALDVLVQNGDELFIAAALSGG